MSWRLWTGVWICIFSVIFVAVEGSFMVRYVTRFTQEIFAFMISLIFIIETFTNLAKVSFTKSTFLLVSCTVVGNSTIILRFLFQIFKKYPLCWDYDTCLEASGKEIPHLAKLEGSNISMAPVKLNGNSSAGQDNHALEHETLIQPNIALISLVLTIATFVLAYYFKELRNKKVLGRTVSCCQLELKANRLCNILPMVFLHYR